MGERVTRGDAVLEPGTGRSVRGIRVQTGGRDAGGSGGEEGSAPKAAETGGMRVG